MLTAAAVPASPGALFVNLLGNFETTYGAQLIGCTAVRIRGTMSFNSLAPADLLLVAGARVIDDQDVATLSGTRGPLQDLYADWQMWTPYIRSSNTDHAMVFDTLSSRKIEELGQGLYLAVQTNGVATTLTMALSVGVKLP